MTFAQYIVFIEEMYESAVNNNAEDFPKVTVDTYSTVVIGVKFVSTFVDWGDQSLVLSLSLSLVPTPDSYTSILWDSWRLNLNIETDSNDYTNLHC